MKAEPWPAALVRLGPQHLICAVSCDGGRLTLENGGPIRYLASERDVADAQANEVTASELAVQAEIE
jgi:hypothetical protein